MTKKLKKRHEKLVKSEMNIKRKSQSGMSLVIETEGWSQVQASWRFYNNEDVKFSSLNDPIIEEVVEQSNKSREISLSGL